MQEIKVVSVNISEKKGTIKTPVHQIQIDRQGVVGDAHAGDWHRQVSLLAKESIDKFSAMSGQQYKYGEFAENITTEGMELYKASIGDRFRLGELELEITQIGKECHGNGCAIFVQVGKCVMPKEGVFCKVISPGKVKAGDQLMYHCAE
jgi:MOSC domain-containing protein YiiM